MPRHVLFGLTIDAPVGLPAPLSQSADVDVTIVTSPASVRPPHLVLSGNRFTYATLDDGSVYVAWFDQYEFVVSATGDRIIAHNITRAADEALFTYLLSHALSVTLLKRGLEGLHAACIASTMGGVAFLGDGGFGKSTLAAFALKRGARLATDDLLVCATPGNPVVLPGAARIKLERDHGIGILGDRSPVPISDADGKWIFPLRDDEFAASPVPLKAMLVLQPHADALEIRKLGAADAFKSLLAATFDPLSTDSLRLQRHMRHAQALAQSTPLFVLTVPRDVRRVDAVLDLVENQLAQ